MHIRDLEGESDEDLVRAFVKKDDRDALEVLLRRHESRVYGLAFRLLGNRADALDATQETFINVFRKARTFKGEAAFTTWLHRLTTNACHDLGRKQARTPEPAAEIEAPSSSSGFEGADSRIAIELALTKLPELQRTVAILRDLRGFSYLEIAEITATPVGTVKSRIARARSTLAAILFSETRGEPAPQPSRLTDTET